jgi:hypothetical protein
LCQAASFIETNRVERYFRLTTSGRSAGGRKRMHARLLCFPAFWHYHRQMTFMCTSEVCFSEFAISHFGLHGCVALLPGLQFASSLPAIKRTCQWRRCNGQILLFTLAVMLFQ